MKTFSYLAILLACAFEVAVVAQTATPIPIDVVQRTTAVSFQDEILPILQKNCIACHSASEKQGKVVLESPQSMLQGGDVGAVIVPGRGTESLLLKLAAHSDEPLMPPADNDVSAKDLTSAELGLLKLWIDQGAKGGGGIDSLSPKQWQPLPTGFHPVQAVALTEDGQFVACSRSNQIFLYHIPTGQLVTKFADASLDTEQTTGIAHRDMVQSLAFNGEGDLLASGGFREVKIWQRPRDVQRSNIAVGAPATSVAVSPDKKSIAVAGTDHVIRLFDIEQGQLGHSLQGHTNIVTSLRFTPDGQQLVSGSLDQTVRFWNTLAGSSLSVIETSVGINAIELVSLETPTETTPIAAQWLVTGNTDNKIGIWELSGTAVRQLSGHSQPITSLVADPKNVRHFYSGSLDGSIRRWNLDNEQAVQQFNHGGPVNAIAISPDGMRLASASENHTARLFSSNGQQIAELRGDVRSKMTQLRAQQLVASASARLNLSKRLFDEAEKDLPVKTDTEKKLADSLAESNKEVIDKQAAVDQALVEKLAIEKAAIDASAAAKIAIAEKEQSELLSKLAAMEIQVAQAKISQLQLVLSQSPDSVQLQQLLTAAQQEVAACQQKAQQLSAGITGPTQKAEEMVNAANVAAQKVNEAQKPFSDKNTELKTAQSKQNLLSQQQSLALKELTIAKELVPLRKAALERAEAAKVDAEQKLATATAAVQSAEQPLRSIAFSPDGTVLVTAGDFLNMHSWDGMTGAAITAFAGHTLPVRKIMFLDDARFISVSDDQSCRVWELNPNWVLRRTVGDIHDPNVITHRATAVDFNTDASQLLVASGIPSRGGELHVFNVADGSRTFYLPHAHDDVIYSARFSPEGKRIASGGADKYLRTFDIAAGVQLRRFEGHTNYVLGVAWNRDGETIASSSADNTIKIWEAETGDQRRTIDQQLTKHVTAIQFVGETSNLISSSGDKQIRMHNADNGGVARNYGRVNAWPHCIATTPDNKYVVVGDANGAVTIWNGTNGQLLHTLSGLQ